MSHTSRDKKKLLDRVRRIRGQVDPIERPLDGDLNECSSVLQTIAARRGAINGLMAEIIEGHIRFHVVDPNERPQSRRAAAAQEVIDAVKPYIK